MRSAEEIIEWVKGQNFVFVPPDTVVFMRELLKFIESEPPCQHYAGVGTVLTSVGWMPFRIGVGEGLKADQAGFVNFKFCPDCGAELEKLTA